MLLQMNPHSASCPQSTSKGASLSTWQSNKLRWPDFFSIHPVSCWSRVVYIISPCCCSKGHIADRYRGIHQGVLQATKKGLADFYLFIFFGWGGSSLSPYNASIVTTHLNTYTTWVIACQDWGLLHFTYMSGAASRPRRSRHFWRLNQHHNLRIFVYEDKQ